MPRPVLGGPGGATRSGRSPRTSVDILKVRTRCKGVKFCRRWKPYRDTLAVRASVVRGAALFASRRLWSGPAPTIAVGVPGSPSSGGWRQAVVAPGGACPDRVGSPARTDLLRCRGRAAAILALAGGDEQNLLPSRQRGPRRAFPAALVRKDENAWQLSRAGTAVAALRGLNPPIWLEIPCPPHPKQASPQTSGESSTGASKAAC